MFEIEISKKPSSVVAYLPTVRTRDLNDVIPDDTRTGARLPHARQIECHLWYGLALCMIMAPYVLLQLS